MKKIYLGLGSNLGDREKNLSTALFKLEHARLHVLRASSIYETEPREVADQPKFLNQVLEAETDMFPRMLLSYVLAVENRWAGSGAWTRVRG